MLSYGVYASYFSKDEQDQFIRMILRALIEERSFKNHDLIVLLSDTQTGEVLKME